VSPPVEGASELDEGMDDTPPPPQQKRKQPQQQAPREEVSSTAEAMSQQDERSVYEFLTDLGTGANLKIKLIRVSPSTWLGHNIKGHLDEFDAPFTEKEVFNRFGGGKYMIRTWKPGARGNLVYSGTKTFEVAGDPKVTGELTHDDGKDTPVTPLEGPATVRAMGMMERQAEEERKRAERFENEARQNRNAGPDMNMINAALTPLRDQIKAMNDQLIANQKIISDKDAKILELVTRKPESTFQDKLLDKMVDGESARIESLRENHASELRQLRETNASDLKSAREHAQDELRQRETVHTREIENLNRSIASTTDALKLSYEGRIDAFKSRISDLEQRLTQQGAELGSLRDKKDKGLIEQMEEMATVKNAMEALGMAGGQEQGSVLERIAMGVLDSPILKAVATRVEQAPTAPPPPQRRRRAPPREQQQTVNVPQQPPAEGAPPAEGQPGQPVGQMVPAKKTIKINPADVKIAVNLLEGAFKNGTDPTVFAESARSMVPGDILGVVKQIGVDAFLKDVAQLDSSSPLATMGGRNFLRKVVKYLTEGVTE